jgi:hypothetical protein
MIHEIIKYAIFCFLYFIEKGTVELVIDPKRICYQSFSVPSFYIATSFLAEQKVL